MSYKDPAKQLAYQRNYQRARRAGVKGLTKGLTVTAEEIKTANALLTVLAGLIKEVLDTNQGDVFMRARTAGYLISIGLRAVEVADLEGRLTNLEDKLGGKK